MNEKPSFNPEQNLGWQSAYTITERVNRALESLGLHPDCSVLLIRDLIADQIEHNIDGAVPRRTGEETETGRISVLYPESFANKLINEIVDAKSSTEAA